MVEWSSTSISLLASAVLIVVLQLWWIDSLLKRNRRRHLAEPLSPRAFRDELEKIFRQS